MEGLGHCLGTDFPGFFIGVPDNRGESAEGDLELLGGHGPDTGVEERGQCARPAQSECGRSASVYAHHDWRQFSRRWHRVPRPPG